jgi:predicted ABC-type ATPase
MEASRLLLARWDDFADQRQSFAIETTLASRSRAPKVRKLQELGYEFLLYYFWLPNPEMAVSRVAERVKSGGHHIPEDVIRRRYEAGWRNSLRYTARLQTSGKST